MSSDEGIGTLAENLLEALREHPDVNKKIDAARRETRAEKKRMAMAMRQKALGTLGMTVRPLSLHCEQGPSPCSRTPGRLICFPEELGRIYEGCTRKEAEVVCWALPDVTAAIPHSGTQSKVTWQVRANSKSGDNNYSTSRICCMPDTARTSYVRYI